MAEKNPARSMSLPLDADDDADVVLGGSDREGGLAMPVVLKQQAREYFTEVRAEDDNRFLHGFCKLCGFETKDKAMSSRMLERHLMHSCKGADENIRNNLDIPVGIRKRGRPESRVREFFVLEESEDDGFASASCKLCGVTMKEKKINLRVLHKHINKVCSAATDEIKSTLSQESIRKKRAVEVIKAEAPATPEPAEKKQKVSTKGALGPEGPSGELLGLAPVPVLPNGEVAWARKTAPSSEHKRAKREPLGTGTGRDIFNDSLVEILVLAGNPGLRHNPAMLKLASTMNGAQFEKKDLDQLVQKKYLAIRGVMSVALARSKFHASVSVDSLKTIYSDTVVKFHLHTGEQTFYLDSFLYPSEKLTKEMLEADLALVFHNLEESGAFEKGPEMVPFVVSSDSENAKALHEARDSMDLNGNILSSKGGFKGVLFVPDALNWCAETIAEVAQLPSVDEVVKVAKDLALYICSHNIHDQSVVPGLDVISDRPISVAFSPLELFKSLTAIRDLRPFFESLLAAVHSDVLKNLKLDVIISTAHFWDELGIALALLAPLDSFSRHFREPNARISDVYCQGVSLFDSYKSEVLLGQSEVSPIVGRRLFGTENDNWNKSSLLQPIHYFAHLVDPALKKLAPESRIPSAHSIHFAAAINWMVNHIYGKDSAEGQVLMDELNSFICLHGAFTGSEEIMPACRMVETEKGKGAVAVRPSGLSCSLWWQTWCSHSPVLQAIAGSVLLTSPACPPSQGHDDILTGITKAKLDADMKELLFCKFNVSLLQPAPASK